MPSDQEAGGEQPFNRKISQQTKEIAMRKVNQDLNRLGQPNLLLLSAGRRRYPENLS